MLHRYPWISYAGLFIVLYVAITMIVHGGRHDACDVSDDAVQDSVFYVRNSKAVASSLFLKRGNFGPSGSPFSIARNSSSERASPSR